MIEQLALEDNVLLLVWAVLILGVVALIPVAIVVSRVYPYAYPNARIRAMRAKLARSQLLIDLAPRSYNDIIIQLENIYPNLSSQYAANLSFANLDSALREHLVTQLEKVKRISPQELQPFLTTILAKYDIQVIETIVRSIATKESVTSDVLHRTKLFSKDFITKKHHTLDDLRNELKHTQYEAIINKHYEELKKNNLKSFEEELDQLYFKKLLRAANTQESRGYVRKLIDAHNIALTNQKQETRIAGGKIPKDRLTNDLDAQQLAKIAQEYNYTISDDVDAQTLERDMHKNIKTYAKQLLKQEPLSQASIIGFVALQAISVRNTVILLKMKYHDMTVQRIQEVIAQ